MRIGRGIVEAFEAIPERIEVDGHAPTWRVTGGSFESVVDYANEAFDEPVVLAREDRRRWWPRVTLTVTTDPELAAEAPPLETLLDPEPAPEPAPEPQPEPAVPEPSPAPSFDSVLDEMFDHQEDLRLERLGIPTQRLPLD